MILTEYQDFSTKIPFTEYISPLYNACIPKTLTVAKLFGDEMVSVFKVFCVLYALMFKE